MERAFGRPAASNQDRHIAESPEPERIGVHGDRPAKYRESFACLGNHPEVTFVSPMGSPCFIPFVPDPFPIFRMNHVDPSIPEYFALFAFCPS